MKMQKAALSTAGQPEQAGIQSRLQKTRLTGLPRVNGFMIPRLREGFAADEGELPEPS